MILFVLIFSPEIILSVSCCTRLFTFLDIFVFENTKHQYFQYKFFVRFRNKDWLYYFLCWRWLAIYTLNLHQHVRKSHWKVKNDFNYITEHKKSYIAHMTKLFFFLNTHISDLREKKFSHSSQWSSHASNTWVGKSVIYVEKERFVFISVFFLPACFSYSQHMCSICYSTEACILCRWENEPARPPVFLIPTIFLMWIKQELQMIIPLVWCSHVL